MKGDPAQGVWPDVNLVIDGSVVASTTVDSNSYKTYTFTVNGYAGTHDLQIHFTNDYYLNGEDRNLYVQSATVSGVQHSNDIGDSIDLTLLDADTYVLSNYEVASFLSYTLTGSTPDRELMAAAKRGDLTNQAKLEEQEKRLLSTDRAKKHMGVFAAQWLGTDEVLNKQKDSDLFPGFTQEVREAMASEVKAFFTHVFYDQNSGFDELFKADYVYANKPLAEFYGLGSVDTNSNDPNQMVKVDASSAQRGGLLTLGAFLSTYADQTESSPIRRAVNLRTKILCQDTPKPDATIATFRAEKAEELIKELKGMVITNRDFVGALTKESPCDACHEEIINPLGFGFEDYDAVGRHRDVDANSLSVDSSGIIYGVNSLYDGNMISFHGAKDLSNKLAELETVKTCFSANVFRYAMDIGHDAIDAANENAGELTSEEKEDYACSVEQMTETLSASNSMADVFTRLGSLDLVRFRKQRDR